MEANQEELLKELIIVETMVKENPCRMKQGLLSSLTEVVRSFIGKHCIEGATREQVAKYFQRDVRTISHWKDRYDDFPKVKKDFSQNKTYNWIDIVEWKLKHKELYEN